MSEEFDFSELRNYLQGQMDLDCPDLLLDEPWALNRPNRRPVPPPQPVRTMPTIPQNEGAVKGPDLVMSSQPIVHPAMNSAPNPAANPVPKPAPSAIPAMNMPSERPVRKPAAAAYESADSLDSFYGMLTKEPVYAGAANIFRYEGPSNPKLLMLFPAPHGDIPAGQFWASPTGEMLSRLFANLNIEQSNISVSYFYKSATLRNLSPLLETSLRKMLAKELTFIQPAVMVTFGEPLFHQIFGKGKSFNDLAGTDLEFSGFKTCALVDAFAMTADKQLKWLTWKVHIPRCTYLKV